MERLAELIKVLVQAGWAPISVVNIIGTCGLILLVLRVSLDPRPTLGNLAPAILLVVFLIVCLAFIAKTSAGRER